METVPHPLGITEPVYEWILPHILYLTDCQYDNNDVLTGYILQFHLKIIILYRLFWVSKNLGRLWLAYTDLQCDFYMLQLVYVSSKDMGILWRHIVIGKDHGHLLIKSAQHSLFLRQSASIC